MNHFFVFFALSGIACFTLSLGISNCFQLLYEGLLLRDTDAISLDSVAQFMTLAVFAAGIEVFRELPALSQHIFMLGAFIAPLGWIWFTRSLTRFSFFGDVKYNATLIWLVLWLVLLAAQGNLVGL